MSVRVMADVWDFGPDDPVDCSVLVCLANHCNDEGQSCYPSIPRIAKMIRRSERTVQRSITALETDGWVSVERSTGGSKPSQYTVNTAKLKGCHSVTPHITQGCQPRQAGVTATTARGDSHDKPPHPLIGVTIKEPSEEPSGSPEPTLFPEDVKQDVPTPSQLASLVRDDLFPYYLERTERNAKMYTLTPERLKHGVTRLRECLVKTDGDLPAAQKLFWRAIEALTESEFYMGNNDRHKKYNDWIKHLTKSTEKFEEWVEEGMAA